MLATSIIKIPQPPTILKITHGETHSQTDRNGKTKSLSDTITYCDSSRGLSRDHRSVGGEINPLPSNLSYTTGPPEHREESICPLTIA
jgi:hypothetical protein